VHSAGNWGGDEDFTESWVTNQEELDIELDKEDNQEPPVVVNILDNVVLSVILRAKDSAVNQVEQVHHHESLEQERVVLKSESWGPTSYCQGCINKVVLDVENSGCGKM
jgi:hypothetical protein